MSQFTYGYPEHDRWGQPSPTLANFTYTPVKAETVTSIPNITHPLYDIHRQDWEKWRMVMESGDAFNEAYIIKYSERESNTNYRARKQITPTAEFAKGAIVEIKNSIFQRTAEITRTGGSKTYEDAVNGRNGGVNLKNGSMNWFLGHHIILDLLSHAKVGIYVDSPNYGVTLKDSKGKHPYLYTYQAEDIRSWAYDSENNLTALLLRDYVFQKDEETGLPKGEVERFRLLKLIGDHVTVQFYTNTGVLDGDPKTINIPRIPFVCPQLTDSLLKGIANHQIALTNLESSDLAQAFAMYPLFTEQVSDMNMAAIKQAQLDNPANASATCPPETPAKKNVDLGVTQGRQYPKGMERPGFINPSADPLRASMEKQESLKSDIRLLVNLALSNLQPKAASEESKKMDDRGLEAGLSAIGLELELAERNIAEIWHLYEGNSATTTITYPKRWSLKSQKEVNTEAKDNEELRDSIPSKTFQKVISKSIATTLVGDKVSEETLAAIHAEIDSAEGITSDPDTILADQKAGLISDKTAATLRGYDPAEVDKAATDHAARASRILKAQTKPNDPAARGVPELGNPQASEEEKIDKPGRGQA